MSAHWPYRWTGRIAFVFGVIAFASCLRIDVEGVPGSMSTKTGCAPTPHDRPRRGEERVRRRDDLVAGPDPERHQRDEQGVGAGGHADGVLRAAVVGDRLLERLDLRAQDEALALEEFVRRRADLVAEGGVLLL